MPELRTRHEVISGGRKARNARKAINHANLQATRDSNNDTPRL